MTPVESRTHVSFDVRIHLVEAFLIRLQLVGFERRVDGELRLRAKTGPAGEDAERGAGRKKTDAADRHHGSRVRFMFAPS